MPTQKQTCQALNIILTNHTKYFFFLQTNNKMAGTRLVYGDGWEDLKDCFSGTLGFNRGQGGSSTRSSRQRVYGGDHYVHPHHLGNLAELK